MFTINNLTFGYGSNKILDQLNFSTEVGSIHGILGKNGMGKTTLFNLIYNTLSADSGTIEYENAPLHNGLVAFLETENHFYPYMKGTEYIQLIAGSNAPIEEWNSLFELPLNQFIENYSTGMKKKLALMAVLTLNRPIIVLDEPFNGVDLEASERIFMILETLKKHKTILISSHILNSLTRCCDQISVLENKRLSKTFEKGNYDTLSKLILEDSEKHKKTLEKLIA